jgi:hypothetical protein
MNERDLIWAAGFFDGEGTATITGRRYVKGNLCKGYILATVVNSHREVLEEVFLNNWGGAISPTSTKEHVHRWRIYNGNATKFLKDILPYLKIKWQVAELVLEFSAYQQGLGMLCKENEPVRFAMIDEIRALNAKHSGYKGFR